MNNIRYNISHLKSYNYLYKTIICDKHNVCIQPLYPSVSSRLDLPSSLPT